ncbi:Insulin receptor substrate 1 [Orchesella cincta]|uniref:Insulin receptor substrate 1 n=1 Tax=Orchesella cincta TaxID=48709 RepID=A0A1D2MKD4_ORCCI|nr:Insulin receptor substrate 1 [Orchesella cincta]
MQNYSKEDLIPRDRESRRHRTYTWNNDQTLGSRTSSFHSSAPPQMTRINSMDGSIPGCRNRIDSVSSSVSSKGFGMSPPVPIMSQTPSFAFNSPLCSTGTDSASSSYSIDYDNNNHHIPQQREICMARKLATPKVKMKMNASDYVETSLASKDSNSTAQTPSSYMEMQSPMSPFDNYMPMSPGCGSSSANLKNSVSGKISVSHSRNSSLIEEHDGYVPMNPTAHTCESGGCSTAGSTTGLDDQYLDMDFGRKLNLSNDDMRHMSPASSESIQSGTPSSDFPLEKVSSYLTDDFDDTNSMRPMRAYSVGSRSDTSSAGKNRAGKNRLEAVQETFRIRAMSVGSKAKRPFTNQSSGLFASPSSILPGGKSPAPPLSSSWSGSTGRWPANKLPMTHGQMHSQTAYTQPMHNHTGSESNDSDLMELDFSHNKSKSRKRSLPGPNGNHTASSSAGSGTSSVTKISPVAKGVSSGGGRDTPSKSDLGESSKSTPTPATTSCMVNGVTTMPKYASSAPISIQKAKSNDVGYHDSIGSSILTKMTGMDLKQLKELDDDGAYLDMDFTNKPSEKANTQKAAVTNQYDISSMKNNFLNRPVVVRPNESPTACKISRFSVNANPTSSSVHDHLSSKAESSPLVRSLSSSSNISTLSNHSNSSSNSSMSVKTQQEVDALCRNEISPKTSPLLHNSDHAAALSRIEECPEKLESRSLSRTPLQSPPRSPHHITTMEDESKVTYAAIEHLPPVRRGYSLNHPQAGPSSGSSCGSSAVSAKTSGVTYAQIDFVKSPETITPN